MDMMVTERQRDILDMVIREYVDSAKPVSSQLLEKRHDFGVCSATLRNEMQELTDMGFLLQPHTSAGRVPTDKGYRFFVDRLFESERESAQVELDCQKEIREITKFLARESSNLALGYWPEEEMLWKEGWDQIFQEPEFFKAGLAAEFAQMLNDFEENIESIVSPDIRVYIGRENPLPRARDFSIITTSVFAILGPKRMDYDKNINLLKSATKWLKK